MSGIAIEVHEGGVVLSVRVHPGARRDGVVGIHDGALKVAVSAAPEQGKANKAVADVLCGALGVRRQQVELVSGGTSRQKRFAIEGMTAAAVRERLGPFLGS